jgi:hypothetical protein
MPVLSHIYGEFITKHKIKNPKEGIEAVYCTSEGVVLADDIAAEDPWAGSFAGCSRATRARENFFTAFKKGTRDFDWLVSSTAKEELTFSQWTSSPCAAAIAIVTPTSAFVARC